MFDVAAAREAWSAMIAQCKADKLVFLDESGVKETLNKSPHTSFDGFGRIICVSAVRQKSKIA